MGKLFVCQCCSLNEVFSIRFSRVLLIAGEFQCTIDDAVAMYADAILVIYAVPALVMREGNDLLLTYNADNYWISRCKSCKPSYNLIAERSDMLSCIRMNYNNGIDNERDVL